MSNKREYQPKAVGCKNPPEKECRNAESLLGKQQPKSFGLDAEEILHGE